MNKTREKDYLNIQLLETRRMLEKVSDHPIMSISLKQRERNLLEQIDNIPTEQNDTNIVLLFFGNPVKGSQGIDASFLSKALIPFQNMVTAEFAHSLDGSVGKRGRLNKRVESKLYLTSLPRGSFGVELSKLESANLDEENQFSNALQHVTNLVKSSSESDENFAEELSRITRRTVQSLKEFFWVISDEHAGIKIETGHFRFELNPEEVQNAYKRVSETQEMEQTIALRGILKGILLESLKFEFTDNDGNNINGWIDENLSEEQVSHYITKYFNKTCFAILKEDKVIFKNGRERVNYTLLSIEE